jgi:Ricin-type beta-trefoil lectin domain
MRDLGKLALALSATAGLLALAAPTFASEQVKNSGTHKCLDVRSQDNYLANGARVQQYHCTGVDEQQWTAVYVESQNALNYYYLVSKRSGKCMTVGDNASNQNGAQIIQYECQMGAPQMWRFEVVDPPGTTYHLVNLFSSKCLDLNDDLPNDGEKIQIWDCNYSVPAQKWVF